MYDLAIDKQLFVALRNILSCLRVSYARAWKALWKRIHDVFCSWCRAVFVMIVEVTMQQMGY